MAIDLLSCLSLVPPTMPIRLWNPFRELSGRVQARAIGSNEIEVEIVPESKTRLTEKRLYFRTIRYVPANLNLGLFMGLWFGEGCHLGKGKNDYWGLHITDFEAAQLFIKLLKKIFQCHEDFINPLVYSREYLKLKNDKRALAKYKKALVKYLGAKRVYLQKPTADEAASYRDRVFIRLYNLALYAIVMGLEKHFKNRFTKAYSDFVKM